MKQPNSDQKKLGVVFSGGGVRGLAHIGVLKVLVQSNVQISFLSGCSMGGLIAAFFAMGTSVTKIERVARRFNKTREMIKLVDPNPSRRGLIVGNKFRKFLARQIPENALIENTIIPLCLNAVDLLTAKEILLSSGNLLDCIMATTAVPGFFPPVEIGNHRLIDGGVLNNLPVSHMKDTSAEVVLAVDVHYDMSSSNHSPIITQSHHAHLPLPEFFRDFYQAEMIMVSRLTELNLEKNPPDILIRPNIPPEISLFLGFQRVNEVIECGEKSMQAALPALLNLIKP